MSNKRRPSPNAPGGSLPDILSDLLDEGHLSPRLARAAMALIRDLQAPHGRSAGLVGSTAEKIQTGLREPLWPSGGPRGIVAFDERINRLWQHERQWMAELVKSRESARGSLADLGRQRSGYKTAKTTRAVAVGMTVAFLHSLAEIYFGPDG